jgi:hypothetical protein
VYGARAVQRSVFESFPDADISGSIVWINMLQGDTHATAQESARILDDARVRHFHDPRRRTGKAIARSLGGQSEVAWDIYLFFAEGRNWVGEPPPPVEWTHQLSAGWADPEHLRFGDDLVKELHRIMKKLTAARSQ